MNDLFDKTQNLYIEGDNLEALHLLKKNYQDKIKLIYIDPPYNTGHRFVYNDKFSHQQWSEMMRPRLAAARELLSEDGSIFISIDHHELVSLITLCDEIFDSANRVAIITVINNMKGRSDDPFFATCNEFLIVYAKSKKQLALNGFEISEEEYGKDYDSQDEIGHYKLIGFRKTGRAWKREERPYMFYPVLVKNNHFSTLPPKELKRLYNAKSKTFDDSWTAKITKKYSEKSYQVIWPINEQNEYGRWRWGIHTFYQKKDHNLSFNSAGTLCTKMRATLEDGSLRMKTAKTLWYKPEYDTGSAARQFAAFMGITELFQNPKSLAFMQDIIKIGTEKDSIVLDFFSGTATTAHAVMLQNAEDGGQRRFVMIQLPEPLTQDFSALKARYTTICDIGKERLRKAQESILKDYAHRNASKEGIETHFKIITLGNKE